MLQQKLNHIENYELTDAHMTTASWEARQGFIIGYKKCCKELDDLLSFMDKK